jgi:hypothetical protein
MPHTQNGPVPKTILQRTVRAAVNLAHPTHADHADANCSSHVVLLRRGESEKVKGKSKNKFGPFLSAFTFNL